MQQPLTNVLVKIFARGFYKVNSGLLLFLFMILFSYVLFINTAGDVTLLPPGKELYYHFIIIITFISDPIMTALFFVAWLIYTIKSWQYVSAQLLPADNQFLFYSSLSFTKQKQFKSWFYTQFIISLPFVSYAVLACIIRLLIQHYLITVVIIVFIILLIAVSALLYVRLLNNLVNERRQSWLLRLSRYWHKPFFSLFIYYVFDKLKLIYVITKFISYLVIIGALFSFADVRHDLRVAGLTILGIVTAHAIIIYRQHRFEQTYLSIARNFPYSMASLYINYVLGFLLLLLPEGIWLFISFNLIAATSLLLLALSLMMLFHGIIYKTGLAMNNYLPWVLGLFILLFCFVLFGLMWLLVPLCLLVSSVIFYRNYYRGELVT
jgi:hypothetical protein